MRIVYPVKERAKFWSVETQYDDGRHVAKEEERYRRLNLADARARYLGKREGVACVTLRRHTSDLDEGEILMVLSDPKRSA